MSIKHLHIYKQWRSVGNNTAISFLPRSRRRSKVDFQCATKGAYTNISIQKKNLYYIIKSGHQNFFKLSLVAYIKAWILKKQDYETRRYIMPIYIHAPTNHFLLEGRYMLEVVRSGWWVPLQASSIYLIFQPAISYLVKAILAAHEPLDCFHRRREETTPPPVTLRCLSGLSSAIGNMENRSGGGPHGPWPSLYSWEAGSDVMVSLLVLENLNTASFLPWKAEISFFYFLSQAFQGRGHNWGLIDPRCIHKEDLPQLISIKRDQKNK